MSEETTTSATAGDIVREAVAALREARERPDVVVDPDFWADRDGSKCRVCLGGAWAFSRRGWALPERGTFFDDGEINRVMDALDDIRRGSFSFGAHELGLDQDKLAPPPAFTGDEYMVLRHLEPGAEEILLRVAAWMDGEGA